MNLKRDVVIVNEYSVPTPGGGGSRGGTPGNYVMRYMARDGATETVAPIRKRRLDDFILRYMAREDAVERAEEELVGSSRQQVKGQMRAAQGYGGVAFGYGSISLSDEELSAASADIQNLFDSGHTVMKTVVSFDEDYLRREGILPKDFIHTTRGDYRGNVDQMKLRHAITHGLRRMSAGADGFDDLRYVGVIQIDARSVHAHLAMVDAGHGRLAPDGTQRGKLGDRHKSRLRRGIDAWLDEKQKVAHLSSAVGYERRNVTSFIKRWALDKIRGESMPQFLLACLPNDRTLWRAGSNHMAMRKADELVTDLVTEQLDSPGSPMPAAMSTVYTYANTRRDREALTQVQWQKLVDDGRRQIVQRASNAVYQMLRTLPESELTLRTPMLQVMSTDYRQLAEQSHREPASESTELVTFGFRLRSYSTRLRHHRERAGIYRDLKRQWEQAERARVAPAESEVLHQFYGYEYDWHTRLAAKYQHFLPVMSQGGPWWNDLEQVTDYGQRLLALQAMRGDASLQRMKDAEAAEALGREIYGQVGGRLLTEGRAGRAVLDSRLATMRNTYQDKVRELEADLTTSGLVLNAVTDGDASGAGQPVRTTLLEDDDLRAVPDLTLLPGTSHDFEQVKSLDLHHLGYDFAHDVQVGRKQVQIFAEAAEERRTKVLAAAEYLEQTGQDEAMEDLPVADTVQMSRLAQELLSAAEGGRVPALRSRIAELRQRQEEQMARTPTTTLDVGLALQVRAQVDAEVRLIFEESAAQEPDSPELH